MQSINSYRRAKHEAEAEKKQRPQPDWEPDSMELEDARRSGVAWRQSGRSRAAGVPEQNSRESAGCTDMLY